ncbi:hypothetical protein PMAYCL1PPCAC_22478 [Pristionchus mayeri]|uniref:Uncharacterized protein n=1 Tax=Pristionchus mayeri TaxID=1317129 RepID=A0AAN5CWU6_9BILA|nr:hypothetical protein PMAYCL1PPCAC_22478 [Pristionchus mayeri]
METTDLDEIERLREQVRLLSSENKQLKRENITLNERLSHEASRVSKAAFTLTAVPTTGIDTPVNTEPIKMGGVDVRMFGAYMFDNEGARQFQMSAKYTNSTISSM